MKLTLKILKLILVLLLPLNCLGALVTTSLKLNVVRPFEGEPQKLTGYKKAFFDQIKRIENKNYKSCSKNMSLPKGTPKRMQVWWSYMGLNCLDKIPQKDKSKKELSDKISEHIKVLSDKISEHIKVLNKYSGDKTYLSSHLGGLIVGLSQKRFYRVSDEEKQFLIKNEQYLNKAQRAKFYNFMASRYKNEKQLSKAANFYSLAYETSGEQMYATRLKTILNGNPALKAKYNDFDKSYAVVIKKKEKTAKFNSYYRKSQYTNIIKEGVRLLNVADTTERKIISKMFRVLRKKVKSIPLKSRIAKESLKCHSECLYKFSKNFYLRHNYKLSIAYAEASNKSEANSEAQLILGMSKLHLGKYDEAKKWLNSSYTKSAPNSKVYFEALFRLGLLNYRLKDYKRVKELFTGIAVHKESNNFNLQTNYWHWRALQKLKDPKQNIVRDRLIKQYPLTYYGLMANQVKNNGKLILPTNYEVLQKEMAWSPAQKVSWENFKDFVEMQFFYLARKELKILFDTEKGDIETVLYSYYSSIAADHYTAIKSMNIIWNKDPNSYFTMNTTKLTLPVEYDSFVRNYAKKNNLEVNLVRSLIKQESSFRVKALSGSNAMGLMQIVPMTAKDAAKYIRVSTKNLRTRIYEPELNVRLGTSYLRRLVRAFKGHIPLSLAAYNAGIGNIRRWMKYRPADLEELQTKNSSLSEDEIWIDELPWAETSFYVKAIMRNLILYRFYYNDVKKIPEPSWATAEKL